MVVSSSSLSLRAQTCDDWKAVTGWQGTYTLTSNGQVTHGQINRFFISETSGATVNMLSQTDGLCNQLRWQGADLRNTGAVNDSTQVLNACVQGQWFTTDALVGSTGFPSSSELVVDATDGTFSFQPISHDTVTHTVYGCQGQQSQEISWATAPGDNWPVYFTLPQQVGPLTATNYAFSAASRYAGYQDIDWTISFNLTPIFGNQNTLTVTVTGTGAVASIDGFIHCPGVCSHAYPANTQVTLNAAPAEGTRFVTWSGACTGTGPCVVTMTQPLSVGAVFTPPLQFVAVAPCRVIDTRNQNGVFGGPALQARAERSFPVPQGTCNIPSSAQAYSLNVTVVPIGPLGYLTLWPTGENQPLVSTMNSPDGRIKANAAIVPAGDGEGVSFYASDTTNLVVDIDGYFVSAGAPGVQTSQFYTVTPCRVIDTRNANGPLGGPYLTASTPRNFPIADSTCLPSGANIQAYSFNVTAVPHPTGQILGYLTVWPEGQTQPVVSTLNNLTATLVANAAIVSAGSVGGISVYPSNDTDMVVDINGYFAPPGTGGLSLYPTAPCRVLDTRSNGTASRLSERTPVNVEGGVCAPPASAQAYVLNATVVPPGPWDISRSARWRLGRPHVSTLNAYDGWIDSSNMAIVPTTNGSIDAYADSLTQLILDISGYFAP